MKRSNNSAIKPYIPKRLRQQQQQQPTNNATTQSNIQEDEATPAPEVKFIRNKTSKVELDRVRVHQAPVTSIQWSPSKCGLLLTSSLDNKVILWNCSSKKLSIQTSLKLHSEGVKDTKWNSDGRSILTASFDRTCKISDTETGVCKQSYQHDAMVTSAIFHCSNYHVFLSGTSSSGITAWDVRQSKPVKYFKSCFGQVQDLEFLPDNETFLSSAEVLKRNSLDKTIMAWDFKTTAVMSNQIYQEPFTCTCLKLHPSKKCFLAQSAAGYMVMFNTEKPWKLNKYKRFEGHMTGGYHVGFDTSLDGNLVYSGDTNGHVFMYDWYTTKVIKKEKLFTSPCVKVACDPNNISRVCFASWDGTVALWE